LTGDWFIQVKLTNIAQIGHLFLVWFIQESILFRVWFRQDSLCLFKYY